MEFQFLTNYKSFDDAQSLCINQGGKLFEPRDAKITKDVTDHAKTVRFHSFWLGIHDKTNEGTFVYASDDTPIEWNNWGFGEPSNRSGEDCARFYYWEWAATFCTTDISAVCVRYKKGKSIRDCINFS